MDNQIEQFYKPKKRVPMKETELAASVVSWLQEQHWDVYQEVQFASSGGVADIVAVRNNILWIIETKTTYSFDVLEQATRWPVHYRSVAVPWVATHRNYHVAEVYYKVGVLEVYNNVTSEVTRAPLTVHGKYALKIVKRYRESLLELHKTFAVAGSRSGNHLTPYKLTMMEVKKVIESNPGCNMGFLYEQLGKMHYASKESFKGSLLNALNSFERWCKIDTSIKPYRLYVVDA